MAHGRQEGALCTARCERGLRGVTRVGLGLFKRHGLSVALMLSQVGVLKILDADGTKQTRDEDSGDKEREREQVVVVCDVIDPCKQEDVLTKRDAKHQEHVLEAIEDHLTCVEWSEAGGDVDRGVHAADDLCQRADELNDEQDDDGQAGVHVAALSPVEGDGDERKCHGEDTREQALWRDVREGGEHKVEGRIEQQDEHAREQDEHTLTRRALRDISGVTQQLCGWVERPCGWRERALFAHDSGSFSR